MSDEAPSVKSTDNKARSTSPSSQVAAVIIGRNEGERLVRCIASARNESDRIVYVDSGSTDGSVEAASEAGVEVVELDLSVPFTAARARNAGIEALRQRHAPDYIQFIDGDCELVTGWIAAAQAFLDANPKVSVVSGHLRERFPEASVYNRLCDSEWYQPPGRVDACGGIAMMRLSALNQAGGFNPSLIAGEEPELCIRLRALGWEVWRIDRNMALHDAAMTRFSQWWKRARRSGHAAAEGMSLHGAAPERHGVATVRRALLWALALPLVAILGAVLLTPWSLLLSLAYPLQVIRLALREGGKRKDWERALFLTLSKFPELLGIAGYWTRQGGRKPVQLIEYK